MRYGRRVVVRPDTPFAPTIPNARAASLHRIARDAPDS